MHGIRAVFFTAHVELVPALDDDKQSQGSEGDEADDDFPHDDAFP